VTTIPPPLLFLFFFLFLAGPMVDSLSGVNVATFVSTAGAPQSPIENP
jgi:hypothetical protein